MQDPPQLAAAAELLRLARALPGAPDDHHPYQRHSCLVCLQREFNVQPDDQLRLIDGIIISLCAAQPGSGLLQWRLASCRLSIDRFTALQIAAKHASLSSFDCFSN
jgi:hypothetical protein